MRWFIASDIHGAAGYCRQMLQAFAREKAERLLLLGDLLYHGPRNDLPPEYNPKEVIALLNEHASQILCVRGNCEAEVDQMVLNFPVLAEYAWLEWSNRLIFATHGHHFNAQNPPQLQAGDILLCGHTHIPACEKCGDLLYINPGSISIPKNNTPHSYICSDGQSLVWKDLSGREYMRHELT